MGAYKYKVHSAIYSWDTPGYSTRPACNVTDQVQTILDNSKNRGVIPLNANLITDPAPGCAKSFAIIVSIVRPDGTNTTRFCSSAEGLTLNINDSGVECYF